MVNFIFRFEPNIDSTLLDICTHKKSADLLLLNCNTRSSLTYSPNKQQETYADMIIMNAHTHILVHVRASMN